METAEIIRRWKADNPKKKASSGYVGGSVRAALDVLGDQCKIQHILDLANWILKPNCGTCATTCYQIRSRWRKVQGIERDCRTYAGQPRRDMIRDNYPLELSPNDVQFFITNSTVLNRILGKAHSIDQLKEWASLKLKVA